MWSQGAFRKENIGIKELLWGNKWRHGHNQNEGQCIYIFFKTEPLVLQMPPAVLILPFNPMGL
jgi:hypothetical protein